MIYHFALKNVALVVAGLLIALHLAPALRPAAALRWMEKFPRSRAWGIGLFGLAALWACVLTATMDLGEVTQWRTTLVCVWAVASVLMVLFVPEFLAVRGLALLLLLGANVLLDAAFLSTSPWRWALTVMAYLWILAGLAYFATPHLVRDWMEWMKRHPRIYQAHAWFAIGWALLLAVLAMTVY